MDPEILAWLLTPEGQTLLAAAEQAYAEGEDVLATGTRLRRSADAGRVAAAMTQAALRQRAVAKLGQPARRMYFTSDGLEQATRVEVGAHRAQRIAASGVRTVVDLGCGIGADLIALANAGLTPHGVELDPLRVAISRANLAALGLSGDITCADATTVDLAAFDLAFADPARRGARGRIFDPDSYSPPWSFVEALLRRRAAVKVAPGLPHDRIPAGCEGEWVSWEGEVKEAVLWSPGLAQDERRATLITRAGLDSVAGRPTLAPTGVLGTHLYEPDGAVIRAGLVERVAAEIDGRLLDEHIAYLTADRAVVTPFARGYEVLEEVPVHEKALRAALRSRDVGILTIKKRGVDVVPEQLRKRLALRGSQEATLVMTRAQGRGLALLVRPLR